MYFKDKVLSELSDEEFNSLIDTTPVENNFFQGASWGSELLAFFGFWRRIKGANLRVGYKSSENFLPANDLEGRFVKVGDKINIRLEKLYLSELPFDNCIAQIAWDIEQQFDDDNRIKVAHLTSCDVTRAGGSASVGVNVFHSVKYNGNLLLEVSLNVMADRQCMPIYAILQSELLANGLDLSGSYNPVIGLTVPYVKAIVSSLVASSNRNYKLANWKVGFGKRGSLNSLCYGSYILTDGLVYRGASERPLNWEMLTWCNKTESVYYEGRPFNNPYIILNIS